MKYLTGVTTLELDNDRCTGCAVCLAVCPRGVYKMEAGKALIRDRDLCMECGACELNCAAGAIAAGKGVGCAAALIKSMISGGEPTCGCDAGTLERDSCC